MMNLYRVQFTQVMENTFSAWVEAESEEEAYELVEDNPFDLDDIELMEEEGLEIVNILVNKQ